VAAAEKVVRATACAPGEIRALLDAMPTEKVGAVDLDRIQAEGQSFKIIDQDGKVIGGYVLEAAGSEVWVSAAAGKGCDVTAIMAGLIECQAGQFDSIGFRTKRRGLVKKAQRHGYEIAGYIMRKTLK
jgi:hypothetical protein